VALFHIKDVSSRQRGMEKTIELLQAENNKEIISVPHRYNRSKLSQDTASLRPDVFDLPIQIITGMEANT